MKRLKWDDAKWLAGVLDCEGWIGMCRQFPRRKNGRHWVTYYSGITVGNTNKTLITHLMKLTQVGRYNRFDAQDGIRKIRHAWDVRRRQEVRDILSAVEPYLLLRKKQAHLILSLPKDFKHSPDRRKHVYAKLRLLNKKGIR